MNANLPPDKSPVRVLIVDDSAVIRQVLASVFSADDQIDVMGTATDPYQAAAIIATEVPDVITLDVEMPRMDGLTFLRKIISQHPIPVVIISSLTSRGAESAILAMEYGAVAVLKKPAFLRSITSETAQLIIETVKSAASAKIRRRPFHRLTPSNTTKLSHDSLIQTTDKIIAIGASTGGTEAILALLRNLPADSNGILIVQHMPELFTKAFAERLNGLCAISVKEAANGDAVLRGRALIAPGNRHMTLSRSGARYYVELNDEPLVNRHRPSVDVLFNSVARFAGKNAMGIILTGMGADGAKGLLQMRSAGATTIAQDEASCVVFGMPREAIAIGAATKTLSLSAIASYLATTRAISEFS
jgi:two-component system, chemotaxis family, protein-glutamate methylesterase/glutaminase